MMPQLRQLLDEDLPYLTYLKIPSLRTSSIENIPSKSDYIEIITWNYLKLVESTLSSSVVKSRALQGLRAYIKEYPQRWKVVENEVQVVFSVNEPFYRWIILFTFLDSQLTVYLTDQDYVLFTIPQSMLEKRSRPTHQRTALIRFKQNHKNE